MEDIILKVDHVSKKFSRSLKRTMFYGTKDVFKNILGIGYKSDFLRKGEFWSLHDINLEVVKGKALGIIGQNGSGKSTLLRLINGIFPPDAGSITVKGRIGALIAAGAGFHPHMTGRENIYLNGSILGMRRSEIEEKFDSIVSFADIGDFIDAPVSTYSSGMYVRLGFAIAIHSEPEILLADEILAVGDIAFALKCYRKIAEYKKNGGTIILVSHNMQLIRNTCDNVLWIDKGEVKDYGPPQEICDDYEEFMLKKDSNNAEGLGIRITNDPTAVIETVKFINSDNEFTNEVRSGDPLKVRIYLNCEREVKNPMFTLGILTPENIIAIANYSTFDSGQLIESINGRSYVDIKFPNIYLKPGNYTVTVTFLEDEINNILDWHEKMYILSVQPNGKTAQGLLQLPISWKLVKEDTNLTIEKYLEHSTEISDFITTVFEANEEITIFDVGACEGEDSIRYASLFPNSKVYSFEPMPDNFKKIEKHISKFEKKSITPYQIALSNEIGEAEFFMSSGSPESRENTEEWNFGNKSSSLLKPDEEMKEYYSWLKFDDKIKVKTDTIEHFAKENGIKKVDFIHMDVQGAEKMVLEGAENMLKNIDAIWLEVSKVELYSGQALEKDIEDFMNEHGFVKVIDTLSGNSVVGDQLYLNNERTSKLIKKLI